MEIWTLVIGHFAAGREFSHKSRCNQAKDVAKLRSMVAKAIRGRRRDAVRQFSVFTANRLGRLHDLTQLLNSHNVHILAVTVLDTTDSAILRFVVDDPEQARELLVKNSFPFNESELLVVELDAAANLNQLMAALLEAELNINYLYSFITHPNGKSILGLSMEDNEVAEQILQRHQFPVLRQADISR